MKIRKILCILLSLALALAMVVMPASAEQPSYPRGDTNFDGKITPADYLALQHYLLGSTLLTGNYEQGADVDGNKLTNSSDILAMLQHMIGIKSITETFIPKFWTAVPMTSAAQNSAGIYGGEGCQWPLFITFSETDGNVAFMGTDVGGMYKSTDGGVTWAQASIGLGGAGATGIKTDPNNGDRILVLCVNSSANKNNGLYLSTDGGTTYKPVYKLSIIGHRDFRDSIAFDKASYSDAIGGSATAYWLSDAGELYKSTNGGESWASILNNSDYANGHIFVHPENSYVYLACATGFYRSTNGGTSFAKISGENFNGIDVIGTQPNKVYLSSNNGIYISEDSGATLTKLNASGLPTYPTRIEVSPVNPNYMVVDDDRRANEGTYSNATYYSHDGGKTWKASSRDTSQSVISYNGRNNVYGWSPVDANLCLSLGGDFIMRSTDAGKSFAWSNSGYNGAAVTGINCNVNNPAIMTATNQDYSGFISTDYGRTWKYAKAWNKGGWGGYAYGSYPVSASTIVAFKGKDPCQLVYSTDGGQTAIETEFSTEYRSYACVTGMKGDDSIVFANEFRSTNGGTSWSKMNGCIAVFGGNQTHVYGINSDKKAVVSADKGATWTVLSSYAEGVTDMTYDALGNRLLIIAANMMDIYQVNCSNGTSSIVKDYKSATDSFGGFFNMRAIEVDPMDSNTFYVSNARQVYASDVGVLKTTNNGKNFTNITSTRNNIRYGDDGGRQVTELCINPATRHLFAGGGCRGIYKVALDQ
ncbi:MAG: hypothetical protein IJF58_02050 [Clostridia bacterium]|nr:hypothetical protein [Clostridia bacterium]